MSRSETAGGTGTRQIVDALRDVLPTALFESLTFKSGYKNPKKIGVLRASDEARILYLASNQDRLELSSGSCQIPGRAEAASASR